MATIGQQLTAPEAGWTRYDDSDSKIIYAGKWERYTTSTDYNGSTNGLLPESGKVNFVFRGTGVRIITYQSPTYTESKYCPVYIDGVYAGDLNSRLNAKSQGLSFELTGLTDKIHEIELQINKTPSNINTYLTRIDAIDISGAGMLLDASTARFKCLLQSTDSIYTIVNDELQKLDDTDDDKTILFLQGFVSLTKENCELIAQELGKAKIIKMDV